MRLQKLAYLKKSKNNRRKKKVMSRVNNNKNYYQTNQNRQESTQANIDQYIILPFRVPIRNQEYINKIKNLKIAEC